MIEAYPLCWPASWPRTKERERSKFKTSFDVARRELFRELSLMGVPDYNVILSTNIPIRRDGMPYSTMRPVGGEVGVAVYFKKEGSQQQFVFACDRWDRIEDNMQAIRHSIAAIRGIERWGASDMMERAFTGFTALPAPESKNWRRIFGVQFRDKPFTREEIEKMYKEGMRAAHPDMGGSHERAADLNWAIQEARKELK